MVRERQVRRVLLVDDDMLFLEALGALLGADPTIEVVGRATHGLDALRLVEELRPDVVTMDIDMPVMDGVEATRAIVERYPETCVVTITASTSPEHIAEVRAAGASGHIVKEHVPDELPDAIHAACPRGTPARAA
jgi:DNA-binding NarL/FixJ family response regulator